MFDHEMFEKYEFGSIPLNQDIFIVDETYIDEYEQSILRLAEDGDDKIVGYISYAAANRINDNSIELSWYPDVYNRFHEVSISLPKDQFITCVECWSWSQKPRIFVKSEWLKSIHIRLYSIFMLIDAIGVKEALESGIITREKLIDLRSRIDTLAEKYSDVAFISFADSLLIKSNWTIGHFRSTVTNTYEPEVFIQLAKEINEIYQEILGLSTYAVIAQGSNEYYDDPLLHISSNGKHISLNSLGVPFAQLTDIDRTARKAIKAEGHPPAELYMDEQYFRSLKLKYEFDKKSVPNNEYLTKMIGGPCKYYCSTVKDILDNLKNEDK